MTDNQTPSLPQAVLTDAEIDWMIDKFDWDGFTDPDIAKRAFARDVVLEALSRMGGESVPGKYDDVLRPFMALMERELHANSAKGDRPGWLKMDANTALLEIFWHAAKLSAAVKNNDGDRITEHAADVANMSMMLLDVCGGLAVAATPPTPPSAPAGAEWEKLRDPRLLHAALLRGLPAKLSREQFLHLAGVAPAGAGEGEQAKRVAADVPRFVGKGAALVTRLYNDPPSVGLDVDAGEWIQIASQYLGVLSAPPSHEGEDARDAARYRVIREASSQLKLYAYDDPADFESGDWHYKPRPEFVDAWCDAGIDAARAGGEQ